MHKLYFIADPHFGHHNIISFTDKDGKLTRPFKTIEEHDDLIIENINKVVRPQDKLYIMGDVAMYKRSLAILERINTKKLILIRGNHDIFKLKDYTPYFKDIRAIKVMPKHGIFFTHIPVHPQQLGGTFTMNVHGHLHHNDLNDPKYFNISPERIGYIPIELQEILSIKETRGVINVDR